MSARGVAADRSKECDSAVLRAGQPFFAAPLAVETYIEAGVLSDGAVCAGLSGGIWDALYDARGWFAATGTEDGRKHPATRWQNRGRVITLMASGAAAAALPPPASLRSVRALAEAGGADPRGSAAAPGAAPAGALFSSGGATLELVSGAVVKFWKPQDAAGVHVRVENAAGARGVLLCQMLGDTMVVVLQGPDAGGALYRGWEVTGTRRTMSPVQLSRLARGLRLMEDFLVKVRDPPPAVHARKFASDRSLHPGGRSASKHAFAACTEHPGQKLLQVAAHCVHTVLTHPPPHRPPHVHTSTVRYRADSSGRAAARKGGRQAGRYCRQARHV